MNNKWGYFMAGLVSATILYTIVILSIIGIDMATKNKKPDLISKTGTFSCNEINDTKNTFNPNVVISNGLLYSITLDSKFSNEQNCLKLSDNMITKVIDDYYIDNEGNTYKINSLKLEKVEEDVFPEYFKNNDIVMALRHGKSSEYNYYVLKSDGKIYDMSFKRSLYFKKGVSHAKYDIINDSLKEELENENIISFMASKDKITFLKTNDNIYINSISNKECNNYVDVECKYSFNRFNKLKTKLSEIKYINMFDTSMKYIDNSNNIYSVVIDNV